MKQGKMHIELIGKSDCSPCHKAKAVLKTLQKDFDFEITETELMPAHPRYEEFSSIIPVILINGEVQLHGKIDEKAIRMVLTD